ncbi:(+)-neomenthol dehydrogenase-like [Impatiens glandulifera]|uniref:(+)-neomenthol dehydrogenase-like n=1 Tax=Impatiens glandulifera TaxID=253017 RepID=UPI001FB15BD4|nr:(+)-neomenthol dehydrogenase-like [Impatiens glandulifera]
MKCKFLIDLESKDTNRHKIDRTRANVKDLHSQVIVAVHRIDTISKKIEELRDNELNPGLVELINGLRKMWEVMYEYHKAQHNLMSMINQQTIIHLEIELSSLSSCFTKWLIAQKSYVQAVSRWLYKCAFIQDPEASKRRQGEPPLDHFGPTIYTTCGVWLELFDTLPIKEVTDSVKGLENECSQQMLSSSYESYRYAIVTGANKGIGFETVRKLAEHGITVVLTARDNNRGLKALNSLHELGFKNVVFHQLDVLDQQSVDSLFNFIKDNFGRLDILVNNAAHTGVIVDEEGLRALNIDSTAWLAGKAAHLVRDVMKTTHASAEKCLNTNYYGCKRVTKSLLPLLELSISGAKIVNVSSLRSELWRLNNEQMRKELGDVENLTVEKIDRIVERFLGDVKDGLLESNGWNMTMPSYSLSKVTLNAYTRVLAKKYPQMKINCVHPGFVDTDLNWHTGIKTIEEGARGPVKLALFKEDDPTGCYFDETEMAEF